jgi:hypothetical protein
MQATKGPDYRINTYILLNQLIMNTGKFKLFFVPLLLLSALSCEKKDNDIFNLPSNAFIADYAVATEGYLRSIPEEFINEARNTFHIAYQHTSHGTHVSYGLFGLPDFKSGDDVLFGITNNNPEADKLDFRDYALSSYGTDASDLSNNETAFIEATRNYLDDPGNAEINIVMWSWCDITGHDVANNYLPGMQDLIDEYGTGGSKIGSGAGQRENPVTFIFMTGHGNPGANIGDGNPKSQADIITNFCKENHQFCLDYYSIDTHDMEGTYWEDAGDDGNSDSYGGNFYNDWQGAQTLGEDYYENKNAPGGDVTFGEHNYQHITANRKAYAMWYILACIAGYEPEIAK